LLEHLCLNIVAWRPEPVFLGHAWTFLGYIARASVRIHGVAWMVLVLWFHQLFHQGLARPSARDSAVEHSLTSPKKPMNQGCPDTDKTTARPSLNPKKTRKTPRQQKQAQKQLMTTYAHLEIADAWPNELIQQFSEFS